MIKFVSGKHRFDLNVEIMLSVTGSGIVLSGATHPIKDVLNEKKFKFNGRSWSVELNEKNTIAALKWLNRQSFEVISNQDEIKAVL